MNFIYDFMNLILFVFNIVKMIRYRNRNGIIRCIAGELQINSNNRNI